LKGPKPNLTWDQASIKIPNYPLLFLIFYFILFYFILFKLHKHKNHRCCFSFACFFGLFISLSVFSATTQTQTTLTEKTVMANANLEDVPSVDLMTELLRRLKCSSKPDKRLILVGNSSFFLSFSVVLSFYPHLFFIHVPCSDPIIRYKTCV
jgi:hypothetical protein